MNRPNVVVITTHDSGRWFGCYGQPNAHTPNVDRLANDGVRLSQHYCASPICSASRAAMLTGCYPQTNGVLDLTFPPFDTTLNDPRQHLSHVLRDAGYHTNLFHFQHVTRDLSELAYDQCHAQQAPPGVEGRKRPTAPETAEAFKAFLDQNTRDQNTRDQNTRDQNARQQTKGQTQPFYAEIGFFETHTPYNFGGVEPDDSHGVYVPPYLADDDAARENCAHLQGALRRVDDAVGIILDALDAHDLARNTIVVFCTDHGVELPRAKWFLYDAGIEAAMIWRWPAGGISGGRVCDWMTSNVDFMPTLLELIDARAAHAMEGVSYAGGLRADAEAQPAREAIFGYFQKGESRCVRTQRYKLIRKYMSLNNAIKRHAGESAGQKPMDVSDRRMRQVLSPAELYDLHDDPLEANNLAEHPDYAEVSEQMHDRLWRWMESVRDPVLDGPVAVPYFQKSADAYRAWKAKQTQPH